MTSLFLVLAGICALGAFALAEASTPEVDPFMQAAIDEAMTGIINHDGGPFGSVVVKDGKIVGKGHNMVLSNNDASAHGEINAIRDAGGRLGTYDLSGCVIYTTGEPCPMCLFACKWANIDKIYYGCTIEDNALIGFRDEEFDRLIDRKSLPEDYLECIERDACLKLFQTYQNMTHEVY